MQSCAFSTQYIDILKFVHNFISVGNDGFCPTNLLSKFQLLTFPPPQVSMVEERMYKLVQALHSNTQLFPGHTVVHLCVCV